jgi:hypothetical protein
MIHVIKTNCKCSPISLILFISDEKNPEKCLHQGFYRVQTSWFPIVVKLGEIYEINIGWRIYDGSIGFYSAAARTFYVKPPWGQQVSCEFHYKVWNKRGELHNYFKFQNKIGQKYIFKIDLMNVSLFDVNNFTQKIAAMRTGGQDRVFAQYFSLLRRFSHHNPDEHTIWYC